MERQQIKSKVEKNKSYFLVKRKDLKYQYRNFLACFLKQT